LVAAVGVILSLLFVGFEIRQNTAVARGPDPSRISAEVEAAVQAFHAADTSMNAEAVIGLLWPDYTMFVDGTRIGYDDVVAGSRDFMASLELFHTDWTDLEITVLGPDAAVASFLFRDSIVTSAGDLIQARGPTSFVWQRRGGEWRLLFGDADHYPIDP
jgi:ketosteroid isomerase-like protein